MIFEASFDDLMQQIPRNQLVDVGMWEVVCERLQVRRESRVVSEPQQTHDDITNYSVILPKCFRIKRVREQLRMFLAPHVSVPHCLQQLSLGWASKKRRNNEQSEEVSDTNTYFAHHPWTIFPTSTCSI